MAHLIDMTTGQAAIAFVGNTPWHGLGAQLAANADIETWIKAAGLDWEVGLADVAARIELTTDDKPHWLPADEYRITYRKDTGKRFAVVSKEWKARQPRDHMKFFDGLAKSHGMQLQVAGAIKEGAVIWGLASNCREITIKGTDRVKPYLLASTGYDKTQSNRWCFTTVRVVCNNTLRLSYDSDNEGVVKVRHDATVDETDVKRRLGLLSEETDAFEERANKLAEFRPTRSQVDKLLIDLFGRPDDLTKPIARDNLTTKSSNVIGDVETCIVSSPGSNLDSSRGTAWGVLNGVTRYVDHSARARSTDNRLASAWFGRGDELKGKAMSTLLEMSLDRTALSSGLLGDVLAATTAA